jgi:hypothetical protein
MQPAVPDFIPRLLMRVRLVLALSAVLLVSGLNAGAATSTNRLPAQGGEDRFLLIIETSAAMERNAENTQRAVNQLMASGMVGQARPGDTIGLWTFNEELHTGVFPLQQWTPQARPKLLAAATNFMSKVRYEKKVRFEKVVETLRSVVRDSERITVIILSEGSGKISGTPFDEAINDSFRLNYSRQRQQRMPFITVLRAKRGEFIGWRVNTPPFRPEFPAYPVEPKTTEPPVEMTDTKPEPKPEPKAEVKPEPKPPTAPSLIVVGETQAATATSNPPRADAIGLAARTVIATNPPVQPRPETEPAGPAETPVSQTPATTVVPSAAKADDLPNPETQPAVAPTAPTPSTETAAKPAVDSPRKPVESSATPQPPETAPVQTAMATPGESLANRTTLLVAGVALLVAAFGLICLLIRRVARPAEKASLITRSMDRNQDHP